MTIQEYQKEAKRTCKDLGNDTYNLTHMTLGLVTESAELADVLKKNLAYNKSVDWVNVKEEVGDIMWYIANLCNFHNWDLSTILDTNIKKLEARFPEKFTEEAALNRNLGRERTILENAD